MLWMHAEMKWKQLSAFSCFAIFTPHRLELFENLKKGDSSVLNLNVNDKISVLLYGSQSATFKSFNPKMLKFVIDYIKETGCFDRPLFCPNQ